MGAGVLASALARTPGRLWYNSGMNEHDHPADGREPAIDPGAGKVHAPLDVHERESLQRRVAAISQELDHLSYDHLPVIPRTQHRAALAAELAQLLEILCDEGDGDSPSA